MGVNCAQIYKVAADFYARVKVWPSHKAADETDAVIIHSAYLILWMMLWKVCYIFGIGNLFIQLKHYTSI